MPKAINKSVGHREPQTPAMTGISRPKFSAKAARLRADSMVVFTLASAGPGYFPVGRTAEQSASPVVCPGSVAKVPKQE